MAIFDSGIMGTDSPTQKLRKLRLQKIFGSKVPQSDSQKARSSGYSGRYRSGTTMEGYSTISSDILNKILADVKALQQRQAIDEPKVYTTKQLTGFWKYADIGLAATFPPYGLFKSTQKAWDLFRPKSYKEQKVKLQQQMEIDALKSQRERQKQEAERMQSLAEAEFKKKKEQIEKESDWMNLTTLEKLFTPWERPMHDLYLQEQMTKQQLGQYEQYMKELEALEAQGYDVGGAGVTAEQFLQGQYPRVLSGSGSTGLFPTAQKTDWLSGVKNIALTVIVGVIGWEIVKKL